MANQIKLTFAGDSKSLERTFDTVEAGAKDASGAFDQLDGSSGRMAKGIGGMNDVIGASESKFMGAADLADGLSSAFGINTHGTIEMARAFGDMAGGFDSLVGPALESFHGKLGKLSFATKIQTGAQTALNAVMRANPIGLLITAAAAMAIGFTVLYKRSEAFRNGVHAIKDAIVDTAKRLSGLAEIILMPYTIAFRAFSKLWNSTIAKLHVDIPGFKIPFGPSFGGISFGVPEIPELATGGRASGPVIVGERGRELFVPDGAGTVKPGMGGSSVVEVRFVGSHGDPWLDAIRKSVSTRYAGDVQAALGR